MIAYVTALKLSSVIKNPAFQKCRVFLFSKAQNLPGAIPPLQFDLPLADIAHGEAASCFHWFPSSRDR